MLILMSVLPGVLLLVMVAEEAQEMQLAHRLPVTTIPPFNRWILYWIGLWFSVLPDRETLLARLLAAVAVVGSFLMVQRCAD